MNLLQRTSGQSKISRTIVLVFYLLLLTVSSLHHHTLDLKDYEEIVFSNVNNSSIQDEFETDCMILHIFGNAQFDLVTNAATIFQNKESFHQTSHKTAHSKQIVANYFLRGPPKIS